jgi:hypothetical protein
MQTETATTDEAAKLLMPPSAKEAQLTSNTVYSNIIKIKLDM